MKQCFVRLFQKIRPFAQKMLTILDISTDVRMTVKMYHINPYWYMTMVSTLVAPFLVYWSSHHHFERITQLLSRIQKGSQHADSETFTRNYCISGLVSSYLMFLSLPVIGIIFTVLEVITSYLVQLTYPLLRCTGFQKFYFFQCMTDIQESLHTKQANQFFVISELFFESIPQLALQIWIYSRYADTFTDANGVPYITTGDILLSLSAAVANIILNVSMLGKEASRLGLNLDLYIPYFIGSKIDDVFTEAVPVNNWFHTNKKICNLSRIEHFYQGSLLPASIQSIHRLLNQYDKKTLRDYFKIDKKTLVLPGNFVGTGGPEVQLLEVSRFAYQCRYLSEQLGLKIKISQFQTSYPDIYLFPIGENKKLEIVYDRENRRDDPSISSLTHSVNNSLCRCFTRPEHSAQSVFLQRLDPELDFKAHCDFIKSGFTRYHLYASRQELVSYLMILGLTGRTKIIHRIAHYLDILRTNNLSTKQADDFSPHKKYIQSIIDILRELIRDRYNSTRVHIEESNLSELRCVSQTLAEMTEDSYLVKLLQGDNKLWLSSISNLTSKMTCPPIIHILVSLEFRANKYGYWIQVPTQTVSRRRGYSTSIFENKNLPTSDSSSQDTENGFLIVHHSDSQVHRLEIRDIPRDSSAMTFWRIIPTRELGVYHIVSCCGGFFLTNHEGILDIVDIQNVDFKHCEFTFLEKN